MKSRLFMVINNIPNDDAAIYLQYIFTVYIAYNSRKQQRAASKNTERADSFVHEIFTEDKKDSHFREMLTQI